MKHSHKLLALLLCMLCMLCAQQAWAWGNVGHRITGLIAESLLTDTAQRQVQQLLGEESLSVATTYMDTQRGALAKRWPESARWHYDNQPVCQQQSYCHDGHCATHQIEVFRQLLANRDAIRSERALALRLLVHLLGDIHQPLHMADNTDRGGNSVQVRLYTGGERYSLHELFDSVLIKQLQGDLRIKDYATGLQHRYHAHYASWQRGTLTEWATQSHTLAAKQLYGQLPSFACTHQGHYHEHGKTITLPAEYVQTAKMQIPEQLAKAGARIAQVLNSTLQ